MHATSQTLLCQLVAAGMRHNWRLTHRQARVGGRGDTRASDLWCPLCSCSWVHCTQTQRPSTPLAMQVLYERKIIGRVYGSKKEQFQAAFGYELLKSTVEKLGADHPYTVLVPDMRGVDPDDWTSPVPYEKGYYFLRYLEALVGAEVHPKPLASPDCKTYLNCFLHVLWFLVLRGNVCGIMWLRRGVGSVMCNQVVDAKPVVSA
jgi:hypothetical protein